MNWRATSFRVRYFPMANPLVVQQVRVKPIGSAGQRYATHSRFGALNYSCRGKSLCSDACPIRYAFHSYSRIY